MWVVEVRPENTYFVWTRRQHGNAAEIPQFDPLIAAKDVRIQELTVPVEHPYELTPQ